MAYKIPVPVRVCTEMPQPWHTRSHPCSHWSVTAMTYKIPPVFALKCHNHGIQDPTRVHTSTSKWIVLYYNKLDHMINVHYNIRLQHTHPGQNGKLSRDSSPWHVSRRSHHNWIHCTSCITTSGMTRIQFARLSKRRGRTPSMEALTLRWGRVYTILRLLWVWQMQVRDCE